MTRDELFLISFAKITAVFTYIMFHAFLVAVAVLMIAEPPAWLQTITYSPASWVVLCFMFGLVMINFMFIPIAVALANHESMQVQRRQMNYYAHRSNQDRAFDEQPMKFFERSNPELR